MPQVPLRTAAELTGKDRSTLLRAIESGKLSATKSELGRYLIDPAELERVYGALRAPPVHSEAVPQDAQDGQAALLGREVALLRELLSQERSERQRERTDHERERREWHEERGFLRTMLERQTDQVKLLTDQRERQERERAERRSFLSRLLRRAG